MEVLRSIGRWIIYGNVWVAIGATALAQVTLLVFNSDANVHYRLLGVVFFATYATYNLQRVVKLYRSKTKDQHKGDRLIWFSKHQKLLVVTSVLAVILSLVLLQEYTFSWLQSLVLVIVALITFFYVIPILTYRRNWYNLREVPFAKVFIVAFIWTIVTVIFPYDMCCGLTNTIALPLCLEAFSRFFFIFSITLPFDIRDLDYDKQFNLKTIPLHVGVAKTIKISLISLLLFVVVEFVKYKLLPAVVLPHFFAVLFVAGITGTIIALTSTKRKELFYAGVLESTMLLLYLFSAVSRI